MQGEEGDQEEGGRGHGVSGGRGSWSVGAGGGAGAVTRELAVHSETRIEPLSRDYHYHCPPSTDCLRDCLHIYQF